MKNYLLFGIIVISVIIAGYFFIQNQQEAQPPVMGNIKSDECVIENPDPGGYLLKICDYLVSHKDTVYPNKKPHEYKIEKIEFGKYPSEVGKEYAEMELIKVYLDCCFGAGDIAYFNKETKEVVYFSPGDR